MNALLALFERSFRLHLRAKGTHAIHFALVGIILFLLLAAAPRASGAPGLGFFSGVMMVNLLFISLAAVSYFSSAITEEKEEGTLGLLRMTNLDPLAILLGKSTTRLCAALLLLAVQVPFTLLAVALGGISAPQVFAAYFTLGGYTFFVCNLALLASVLAPRTGVAAAFTGGFLVLEPLLVAGLKAAPKAAALPHFQGKADALAQTLSAWGHRLAGASPFQRLGEITTTGFSGEVVGSQFWISVIAGVICFTLAWILFDFFTSDLRLYLSGRIVPRPGSRLRFLSPTRAWTVSAIAWKDYYFVHGGPLIATCKFIGYLVLCSWVGYRAWLSSGTVGAVGASILNLMSWLLALEIGVIGARILREEVRNKTLVGLAGLPFAMRHIVLMKLDGARRALRPGAFLWLIGAVLAGASLLQAGETLAFIGWGILLGFCWSQVWLFGHVAGVLSLRLPWGALPLSITICLIGNLIGLILCFGPLVAPIIAFILVPSLRESMYLRLEEMAGED